MIFSSILFLFAYLPITLLIYYITPLKMRNAVLLVFNLIFYGWGEPVYLSIMLISIFIDYFHGMLIEKNRSNDKLCRVFVASSVMFNLGILFFFKYYDFFVNNLSLLFKELPLSPIGLRLPIGISFYTFQTMSYTIDVYRGDARCQKNIVDFGTFVTLFPQLIAGPIVKYKDVEDQLTNRKNSIEQFSDGVHIFVIGLCKKVLLANNIGMLWDAVKVTDFTQISVMTAWLSVIAFAMQIYFDFSGYSDMARGLGKMLGFEFLINFNYPFISRSITEFWRRWHISLGTWFMQYVYIPLGGNRVGVFKTYRNIVIVWVLTGFWHGAQWNFLMWGGYFALLLVIEKAFLYKFITQRCHKAVGHVYTLFLVIISFAIFGTEGTFSHVMTFVSLLFGNAYSIIDSNFLYYLSNYIVIITSCIIASTPLASKLFGKLPNSSRKILNAVFLSVGLFICTCYLVDASYNPFLYFRF